MSSPVYSVLGVPFRLHGIEGSALPGELAPLLDTDRAADSEFPEVQLHFTPLTSQRWRVDCAGKSDEFAFGSSFPRFDDFITLFLIQARRDLLFVHASSVAVGQDASIFIGASTSGKSTLATALATQGAMLLSDDITPFDPASGQVYPLRRQPKLRPFSAERLSDCGRVCSAPDISKSPWKLRNIFLLNSDPQSMCLEPEGVSIVGISEARVAWEQMLRFCFGVAVAQSTHASEVMTVRSPEYFDRAPSLTSADTLTATRYLLRHLIAPSSTFMDLFRQCSPRVAGARLFHLNIGRLEDTVALVGEELGLKTPEFVR